MNSEHNSIENQKMAEEMRKKREEELFLKYCQDPKPEWLSEADLTEEQKLTYDKVRELNRGKFIDNVISGKIELKDEEKEIFDGRQEKELSKEEIKQETAKEENWYEKLMKEKVPCFIMTKIPTNAEYCGQKQTDEGDVEGAKEWYINFKEKPSLKLQQDLSLKKAGKNDLVIAKKEGYIIIEFGKNYALDRERYREKRDGRGTIAYKPSKEMLENIWDDLKKNHSKENALKLIDPKLQELIFFERDIANFKIILEEKE